MAATEGTVIVCHTKEEFDAQMAKGYEARKLVVIDFVIPGCGYCEQIAPVFAACAKEHATAGLFLKVDVTQVKEVRSIYHLQVYPTFAFERDGVTMETFVGAKADKLRNTIKEFIGAPAPAASASSSSA